MIYETKDMVEILRNLKVKNEWTDHYISEQIGMGRASFVRVREKLTASLPNLNRIAKFLRSQGYEITGFVHRKVTYKAMD